MKKQGRDSTLRRFLVERYVGRKDIGINIEYVRVRNGSVLLYGHREVVFYPNHSYFHKFLREIRTYFGIKELHIHLPGEYLNIKKKSKL